MRRFRLHRIVTIGEIRSLVNVPMPAALALVGEVFGNLRLFWKKVIVRVVGNFRVQTFRVTTLAAQNPLRMICHG